MNDEATLRQGNQIMNLILQKKLSVSDLQFLQESGILTDLFGISVAGLRALEPYWQQVRLAEIALALGAIPKPEINPHVHEVENKTGIRIRSIRQLCEQHNAGYERPLGIWDFVPSNEVSPGRPLRTPWRYIKFPHVDNLGKVSRFLPGIIIRAMGYVPADVYDLMNYIETYKSSMYYNLIALGTKLQFTATVEAHHNYTVGHPGLAREDDKVVFRHNAFSDTNYWPDDDYYFLVRPLAE